MTLFERVVGFRYLLSKKKQTLLSLTTWISVSGVATGVMALIVVISVMNGFGKDLRDKILGFKSHLLIESKEFLPFDYDPSLISKIQKADPRIQEVTPTILSEMIIRKHATVTGVLLKGVSSSFFKKQTLSSPRKSNLPPILLGQELASLLGVFKGDTVEILSPLETTGPFGMLPKTQNYYVQDVIATGVYEYDTKLAYVPLSQAQSFLEYGNKIDGFELKVSDIYASPDIKKNLKRVLSSFEIRDWQELNRNLLSALKLEKIAMYVILSFIILVAALNIMTTLMRLVLEKKKEVSILKAMGAQQLQILKIFLFQGLCIGMSGIVLGLGGGIGTCLLLNRFELIRLPDIYYNTSVPVELQTIHVVVIGAIAFGISLFSSLYPAWIASRLDPLEGIRY